MEFMKYRAMKNEERKLRKGKNAKLKIKNK